MKETRTGGAYQPVGGLMTAGLMLALFIAAFDSTVVATALLTISAALGGAAHYAWPMTAYLASSTVSTLLCGGLAFHFGLKRTYAFGLALFAAASALCAVAPTIEALAAFRLLQGIGGGLLEAGVFIAAAMMLPPRDRGPYLGAASAMYGVASVIGPVIGGAVAQGLSWHVIFVVNIPIAIVAFALSSRSLPGRGDGYRSAQFDAAGSALASLSVLSLVAVFSLAGGAFPLVSPRAAALIALFVILTFALYRVEAAASAPVIPMGLFCRPRVVAGFISGFCVQFALMAGVTYLPRLLQESMGIAAASSGAALIPMTLALMLGSNVSGALFRKNGRLRALAVTSSFVILAAAAAFIVGAQSLTAPWLHCSRRRLAWASAWECRFPIYRRRRGQMPATLAGQHPRRCSLGDLAEPYPLLYAECLPPLHPLPAPLGYFALCLCLRWWALRCRFLLQGESRPK